MHYIHLGRVGLVANFRWIEIFDFVTGFVGMDVSHDDGPQRGTWGWMMAKKDAEPARPQPAEPAQTEPKKDEAPKTEPAPPKKDAEWIGG